MSQLIQPDKLFRYAFNGTVTAEPIIIGPSWIPGVSNIIPGIPPGAIPVQWEIKNNSAAGVDLHLQQGPASNVFTPEAGTTLGNYDVLKSDQAYSYQKRHLIQEISEGNFDVSSAAVVATTAAMAVLRLRSTGAGVFSGWVDCWITSSFQP